MGVKSEIYGTIVNSTHIALFTHQIRDHDKGDLFSWNDWPAVFSPRHRDDKVSQISSASRVLANWQRVKKVEVYKRSHTPDFVTLQPDCGACLAIFLHLSHPKQKSFYLLGWPKQASRGSKLTLSKLGLKQTLLSCLSSTCIKGTSAKLSKFGGPENSKSYFSYHICTFNAFGSKTFSLPYSTLFNAFYSHHQVIGIINQVLRSLYLYQVICITRVEITTKVSNTGLQLR